MGQFVAAPLTCLEWAEVLDVWAVSEHSQRMAPLARIRVRTQAQLRQALTGAQPTTRLAAAYAARP